MSHGPSRETQATAVAQNAAEGSAPLKSVDLKGNQRTVDEPNQEIFLHLLEHLERLNATMLRIEAYLEQLASNDLKQSISKERFFMNYQESGHGRD